jgi:hypothetical protein
MRLGSTYIMVGYYEYGFADYVQGKRVDDGAARGR